MKRGDTVRENGVAAWVVDPEPGVEGMTMVRMVGDDRDFLTDTDDLEPINEDDFCGGCGQVGCGWG
jgi:hypothetical protein